MCTFSSIYFEPSGFRSLYTSSLFHRVLHRENSRLVMSLYQIIRIKLLVILYNTEALPLLAEGLQDKSH